MAKQHAIPDDNRERATDLLHDIATIRAAQTGTDVSAVLDSITKRLTQILVRENRLASKPQAISHADAADEGDERTAGEQRAD